MWRDSTWYQAQAVAASPPVSMIVNATAGPNKRVTGTSGTVRPSRPVLAIRFTPFGAFIWGVNSGFSPWVKSRAAWTRVHSKKVMSEPPFTSAREPT
jgi:hypothetical protein